MGKQMGIKFSKNQKGFTIVELLIVIVIIAILAAITVVAYNGITSRTRQSILQGDLQQTAKLIENYKTTSGSYPGSLSQLNNGQGVTASNGAQYAYTTSGNDYQLTISSSQSTDKFNISNTTGKIQAGAWPGHDGLLAGYPTRDGFTDITGVYGVGDTNRASIGSIPDGSWMIVVLSYTANGDVAAPAGWTSLTTRKVTNSMVTMMFAKIKQSGDVDSQDFDGVGSNGSQLTNAVLLWGRNAAPIGSWVIGSYGDRANNATATTALTPTINVTTAKSLVLSIATERTTAAETNYTSLTGANPWIWIPQPDTAKIQTIAIGYNEQASTGTSQAMTVTYPNSQATNGTAIQIAIPPAS